MRRKRYDGTKRKRRKKRRNVKEREQKMGGESREREVLFS